MNTRPAHTATPLRVLMTADTVGGVWQYALRVATAMRPQVEVHLATLGAHCSAAQRRAAEAAEVRLYPSDFRLEWMDGAEADTAASIRRLRDLAAVIQPDLLHFNNYAPGTVDWDMPVVLVGHSCVESWWRNVHGESAPDKYGWYRALVRESLANADAVVAPSKTMLRWLEEIYGPLRDGRVIFNACDSPARSVAHKRPYILAAGRLWDEAKNVYLLDGIAGALPWPVWVAGATRFNGNNPRCTRHLRTLGFLSDEEMSGWLSGAGIFAHPARYEPFGLAVLEAALHQCALVLADITTLRELWEGAAVFVAPEDAGAWRSALTELACDGERRQSLGMQARRRSADFSMGRMGSAYIDLYHSLVGARPTAKAGAGVR